MSPRTGFCDEHSLCCGILQFEPGSTEWHFVACEDEHAIVKLVFVTDGSKDAASGSWRYYQKEFAGSWGSPKQYDSFAHSALQDLLGIAQTNLRFIGQAQLRKFTPLRLESLLRENRLPVPTTLVDLAKSMRPEAPITHTKPTAKILQFPPHHFVQTE